MSSNQLILITGGAGFIGSHVGDRLLASGRAVRVLDDLSSGKRANVPEGAEFVLGSVTEPGDLAKACEGVDAVVHLAAEVSVPRSLDDPGACVERNAVATQRVISAATRAGVRRIVFASTAAVYGDDPSIPSREVDPPAPFSPYAATKLAGEHLLHSAAVNGGPSAVALRFFNVYGPRQDGSSPYSGVISAFLTCRAKGARPKVFGDGLQSRDFVAVADVARAVHLAIDAQLDQPFALMNIGTGRATTLLDLINGIEGLGQPEFHEARAGDVRDSRPDVSRALSQLGFKAEVGLADGLRVTGDWYDESAAARAGEPNA